MVATIKLVDTAITAGIRTYASVPSAAAAAGYRSRASIIAALHQTTTAPYDIMDTSSITHVMSSLSVARSRASESATENFRGYLERRDQQEQEQRSTMAAAAPLSKEVVRNETQLRLMQLQHSSVSQNISELLTGPTGLATTADNKSTFNATDKFHGGLRSLLRNHVEVGAKELARVGVFGGDKARRYELSL